MEMKKILILSAAILSCSGILMCISISTPHWIDTEMNFKSMNTIVSKGYRGLFKVCQDLKTRGVFHSKCRSYNDFSISPPAYWTAVQSLLIMNVLGSFIAAFISMLLAFYFKSKSVLHLFLLSFFQVLPVCFGLVALAMFTSKNVDDIDKKNVILISSSFGYSFMLGWCSCILALLALVNGFIFTLLSYRNERLQFIAKFEKLENN